MTRVVFCVIKLRRGLVSHFRSRMLVANYLVGSVLPADRNDERPNERGCRRGVWSFVYRILHLFRQKATK